MQLAGTHCGACKEEILLHSEGTWCARCKSPFHRKCIESRADLCPACHQCFEPPEKLFIFSRYCPECLTPNTPAGDNCQKCGTSTRWDERAEYEAFKKHMQLFARYRWFRGFGELLLGIICLLPIAVLFLSSH